MPASLQESLEDSMKEIRRIAELAHYKQSWKGYNNFTRPPFFCEHIKGIESFISAITQDIDELLSEHYPVFKYVDGNAVYNIPCAFDIETSSFYNSRDEKTAIMYVWQFGFNGRVIMGRTWEEFFEFLNAFVEALELSDKRFVYIYVHNLSYEFQFIRKWFDWTKIFALKKRKVLYAQYAPAGLEFRCSYLLANASLAHVGDKLLSRYLVKKLVGDLDYSKVRHSKTPLSIAEIDYCTHDDFVVMAFIQEKIEQDGGIDNIPLTNTGYVRRFCRNFCMGDKLASQKYHTLMRSLQITEEEEYDQNKRAFMGGFTHAGIMHANHILYDVGSADLTSSYPSEIVASYFPITAARFIGTVADELALKKYLDVYCCIFDVKFYNLRPTVEFENYLSISRCIVKNPIVNNGRLISADECLTTLTELDFDIVNRMYTWDFMEVNNLRVYDRGYLPKSLIQAVLKLYGNKTKLKDVPEEVVEYMRSKNMVNAAFGMMVTDIIRPEYTINADDMWIEEEALKVKQLNGYNKNFNRFLYYTWGIYVTAHARHNLFEAILEFGEDYVYADTDSIKGINFDKHRDFFEVYNYKNKMRMEKAANSLGIPFSEFCPKTIKGEEKLLGNWEIERSYAMFKTCGAKRYMYVYDDGTLSLTVAGLNKVAAVPYLLDEYKGDKVAILNDFEDGFFVPRGHTGKQTLFYIDDERTGVVEDYLGEECDYFEKSAIHMEGQSFSMSQTDDYLRLLQGYEDPELR